LGDVLVEHDFEECIGVIDDQVDHAHRETVYGDLAGYLVVVACDREYVLEHGLQHARRKYFGPGSIDEQFEHFDRILIQAYFACIAPNQLKDSDYGFNSKLIIKQAQISFTLQQNLEVINKLSTLLISHLAYQFKWHF
jgi:hypothetical protein